MTKLEAISKQAAQRLESLIVERQEDIVQGMADVLTETQGEEGETKFKLNYSIGISLSSDKVTYGLSWSIKHSVTEEATQPDPNQLTLPIEPKGKNGGVK